MLAPLTIPKYQAPLVIPPAMPRTARTSEGIDYYEIAVRQFQQQILPTGKPATTVWGYGSINHPGSCNYPAFTLEAQFRRPVRVRWSNQLVNGNGSFLPHLLPVDPTLHWANPLGPIDERPTFASTPGPYLGPVPMVVHLHGGNNTAESDGYPEAWYLPAANNLAGFVRKGSFYASPYGTPDDHLRGAAVFQYANDQRATTLWFHDHTLGITRLNVYAGPAGFYILRGGEQDLPSGVLPGPAPALGDPSSVKYYDIPMAIQDRSFNRDGSLFYPNSRAFFDGYTGPYIRTTSVSPIWNPEFFGNTIVVNGKTWPVLEVERRRYRFRFLNGCNARFLILKLVTDPLANRPAAAALPFWQIGSEGGFLPAPVRLDQLLMGNAERADVIVDFSQLPAGVELYLINEGPDEPFGGGVPGTDFVPANPATTGQVMKLRVVPASAPDTSTPPGQLRLPALARRGTEHKRRAVILQEEMFADIPVAVLLGTLARGPLLWSDPSTEKPALGATEVWEIYNRTVDAHPIHIHEVMFEVVNRQSFDPATGQPTGPTRNPEPWESGDKDTVIALPGEITRIKAMFDLPGPYVWHCHIVEHEDNEMMRPYEVTMHPQVDLGRALGYAVLGLNGAKIKIDSGKNTSGIFGDVGLGPAGDQDFSEGFITGSLFVDPSAKADNPKKVVITGGTVARALAQAVADAVRASAQAGAWLPTQVFGDIKSTQTIVGNGGLNVIRVKSIDLKKETLTLQGSADDEFVINVERDMKLNDGSAIRLAGALVASQVLFNLPDDKADVKLENGSQVAGTILTPRGSVELKGASSTVSGAVIAGKEIVLKDGGTIRLR